MSRCLLSAVLCLVLTVRGTLTVSCYQCADLAALSSIMKDNSGPGIDPSSLSEAANTAKFPPCKEFNPNDARFKKECPAIAFAKAVGLEAGCGKTIIGDATIRVCQPIVPDEACQETGKMVACMCTGDFCNSAGLSSPSVLLLLLPAALLAAVVRS